MCCMEGSGVTAPGREPERAFSRLERVSMLNPADVEWESQKPFVSTSLGGFDHYAGNASEWKEQVQPSGTFQNADICLEGEPQHISSCLRKRMLDVSGTIVLGFVSSPLVMVAALAVRLSSTGPMLYRQTRIGRGNQVFTALKFRTMWVNAEERLAECLAKDPTLREQWKSINKLKSDPRVTPVGRVLRRFSLDEIPQLGNVLMGDMSLLGPRPIVLAEIEKYGTHYAAYMRVRPGLTGLWQVSGRNDTTYQQRVDYDSYYVRNWSLWLDAKILARTFRAVISGAGAY